MNMSTQTKRDTMTKTALKLAAQQAIVEGISTAFYTIGDDIDNLRTREENNELLAEMEKQFERVEKLFGFDPGSCARW